MKFYGVTQHAIDRAVERLKQPKHNAQNHLIQLMQSAVYTGTVSNGRVYDHYASRTRIIVDRSEDKIITVYSMDSVKGGEIPAQQSAIGATLATTGVSLATSSTLTDVIRTTIERELRKARRTFKRSYRQYTLALADVNVEIAELFRNKVRCKHPGTQALIQSQIDVLEDEAKAIQSAMQTQESEYRAVEAEAKAYLGAEIAV